MPFLIRPYRRFPVPYTVTYHTRHAEARRWRSSGNCVMIHPLHLELETAFHKGLISKGGWTL